MSDMLWYDILSAARARGFNEAESQGIAKILDSYEIWAALEEAEKSRNRKLMAFLSVSAALHIAVIAAFGAKGFLAAFFIIAFCLPILFSATKGKAETKMKGAIISEFVKLLANDSVFSPGNEYSFDYANLAAKKFINRYDRVEADEDSFRFTHEKDGKSILVRGFELRTSIKGGFGAERDRYVTNRCFLMKGDFTRTAFRIDKPVRIERATPDMISYALSGMASFCIFIMGTVVPSKFGFGIGESIAIGASFAIVGWGVFVSVLKRVFGMRRGNETRIRLENVEFEKLFETWGEDPITTRRILSPAFMERLVSFTKRTWKQYEFMFENESVYVKKPLLEPFLEIDVTKNLRNNADMFINWFAEIKEIVSLIEDTGLFVFSKTEYDEPWTSAPLAPVISPFSPWSTS